MNATTVTGKVVGGRVELAEPLSVPDGTAVVVTVNQPKTPEQRVAEFLSHPAIGMWKDREDMKDSAAWVAAQRAKWRERLNRRD